MALSRAIITELAPSELESFRSSRYRADEQAVTLAALAPEDRTLVIGLYAMLRELDGIVGNEQALHDPAPLLAFIERHAIGELVHRVRRMGASDPNDEHLAEVFHDIRGGALSALFAQLSRVSRIPYKVELGRSLFIVARDHMKMMRNVIEDLDPVARARDLAFREHSLGDLAGAFREFTALVGQDPVVVEVDCPADAIIAESCVEFGAIDRVAYNLLNNAARHTTGPSIHAWLIRFEKDLRIAIANTVSAEQRVVVEERLATAPASLFGDFTTTDSGYGLRIVGALVGHAYGVPDVERLIAGGYLGARIVEDSFVTWFHWPLSDV